MCTQLRLDSAEGKKLCISSTTGRFSEENSFFIARRALDRSNYIRFTYSFISRFALSPSILVSFCEKKKRKKERKKKNCERSKSREIICWKIKKKSRLYSA